MSNDNQRGGIRPLPNPPHVQISQTGTALGKICFDNLAYFFNNAMIHFPIQENFSRFNGQAARPNYD